MSHFGTVGALWRYPVKSLLGESCRKLQFDTRGAEGDRLYAVYDAKGKFGSGKTTRRFQKIDGLFEFRSYYRDDVLTVVFPDGTERAGLDSGTDAAMSEMLGQPVALTREANISHFDAGPVHIVTGAALAALRRALPGMQIDERRFRPNLLLDVAVSEPPEHGWVGRRLRIGDRVTLEIVEMTERCGMTTFAQAELRSEPRLLKHLSEAYGLCLGVYANVIQGGEVSLSDSVVML
jgi:uncharacterized protein YcbX